MKRIALLGAIGAFAVIGCGTAEASTQTITVVNQAHVKARVLRKVERAIVLQSEQFAGYWNTPTVQFGPGGWQVFLLKRGEPGDSGSGHYCAGTCEPWAIVMTDASCADTNCDRMNPWSVEFSHEILEMTEDPDQATFVLGGQVVRPDPTTFDPSAMVLPPDPTQVEVCDPVQFHVYGLAGVHVSDFTLPANWTGQGGPYDAMGVLHQPLIPGP